ncbi:type IV toxin-antitoxin system AbiEi family antitoxin domain-containing protein [Agromyces italicus]|uniref:type IV toxin-antitoxin system AbiEi family antitoxin domain-containing protein n=1 Tax=Agromyces italicus TaxID=279572 RepID=UPI00146A651A|nr:type IV toxin-antitoxin system AbiEi family antitoxin domain-containing protein [Agromyces italicus]
MRSITRVLREGGGVCRASDFIGAGVPRRLVEAALASGRLERIRRGVYADPWIPVEAKRALRVGGRLACVSAARLHGLRVLRDPAYLHVGVMRHASRLRGPDDAATQLPAEGVACAGARLHWSPPGSISPRGFLVPLGECLEQMLACLPALDALCALDSARESVPWNGSGAPPTARLDELGYERLLACLPAGSRAIAVRSSPLSQAVGETVARLRLEDLGIPVRAQFPLPGGYHGDLLIGERLIFEVEGEGPHSAPGAFERDRRRAAWLKAAGYTHAAFSHRQVLDEWDSVEAVVRMLMRRGAHVWGEGLDRPA